MGGGIHSRGPPQFAINLVLNKTGSFNASTKLEMVADRSTTSCGCGYSVTNPSPSAAGRIVNGIEVSPAHKLPYQVYVKSYFSSSQYPAACGGTLLNKRYVLTAMHCVKSGSEVAYQVKTYMGEHVIGGSESIQSQMIDATPIIRSDYDESSITNDIALLKLSQDVVLNANVVPACLPTDTTKTYTNQEAIVSGWGTTAEGGAVSSILKETTVTIVPSSDPTCTPYAPIGAEKMCAYAQGTDSCQGDSGGPLVLKEDGRYTVVGVVSYGNGCARDGYAGVYARVTNYLPWINDNIADGFCSNDSPVQFPTTTTAPPTTAAPSGSGPVCDITCHSTIGSYTGAATLNGIPSFCNSGMCYATDGSDLCQQVDYPCGGKPTASTETASVLTCYNPCNLQSSLTTLHQEYLSGQRERLIKVNVGSIPAVCDLLTNDCCPTDNPSSDLCWRIQLNNFFG